MKGVDGGKASLLEGLFERLYQSLSRSVGLGMVRGAVQMCDASLSAPVFEFFGSKTGAVVRDDGVRVPEVGKVLFKLSRGGLCGDRIHGVNARIFREGVYHDQPIVALEVYGMINMDSTPGFVGNLPGMCPLFRRESLVFVAGCAAPGHSFDGVIYTRPVDSCSGKFLHSLHPKVPEMQQLKNLVLHRLRDHHSVTVENTAV